METGSLFAHEEATTLEIVENTTIQLAARLQGIFWQKRHWLPIRKGQPYSSFQKWFGERHQRTPIGVFVELLLKVQRLGDRAGNVGQAWVMAILQVLASPFRLRVVPEGPAVPLGTRDNELLQAVLAAGDAALEFQKATKDGHLNEEEKLAIERRVATVQKEFADLCALMESESTEVNA